jgi:hypothetical protein
MADQSQVVVQGPDRVVGHLAWNRDSVACDIDDHSTLAHRLDALNQGLPVCPWHVEPSHSSAGTPQRVGTLGRKFSKRPKQSS